MFIAINLIKDDNAIINSFPIIYENNINDISIIDQIKGSFPFKNYINSNIHFSFFNKISLNLCYIIDNDSQYYYENSYKMTDLFELFDIYDWQDFVIDGMRYLYSCAYKNESNSEDIQELYLLIRNKFPKKINKDTVINYIIAQLKEKYDFLTENQIEFIKNNFKNSIKDE